MKASIPEIRKELKYLSKDELESLCLKLAKYKVVNKELMAYQLFESSDEDSFIETIKEDISAQFKEINRNHYYYIKKSVRKILRYTKKYIQFSKQKETEIALLMHFLNCMNHMSPSYTRNSVLSGIYDRERLNLKKCISSVHEDLQLDFRNDFERLSL